MRKKYPSQQVVHKKYLLDGKFYPLLYKTLLFTKSFFLGVEPGQTYGHEIEKDVDSVDEFCFQCRAAKAKAEGVPLV